MSDLKLTQPDTITRLQGDHVLVKRPGFPDRIFQFRTLLELGKPPQLRLVFRKDGKGGRRVDWPVTQGFLSALQPQEPDHSDPASPKWRLTVN